MQVSKLCLLLLAYNHTTEALVIPIRSLPDIHPDAAFVPTDHRPWSKQDVLTFVGVCVAIVTAIIGLVGVLVASPNTRKWLCRPFDWFTQCWPSRSYYFDTLPPKHRPSTIKDWKKRDHQEVHRQLQDRYNELLKMRKGGY